MMSQKMSPGARHPLLAVLSLLLLAPFVGEFVLGNISITAEWPALVLLTPLYGGGALLVRELSRRSGRGWPCVIALGIAYGTIEAGVLDQSLFAPPDVAGVAAELMFVPALGVDLANYATFVGGHVVWSLWIPIVIVETVFGPTRDDQVTPWLGRRGLTLALALYLAGCGILLGFTISTGQAAVSPRQAVAVVLVAAAATVLGLRLRAPRPTAAGSVPRPVWVALGCFAAGTAAFLAPEGAWTLVVRLVVAVLLLVTLGCWSRRPAWTTGHRVAAAGGALLVYTYTGFVLTALYGRTGVATWVGQGVVALVSVLGVVGLFLLAARRPAVTVVPGGGTASRARPVGRAR